VGGFGKVEEVMGGAVHDDFGGGLMGKLWHMLASTRSPLEIGAVVKVFLHEGLCFLFVFFDFFKYVRLAE
jgi:hypothetical protein